MHLQRSVPRAIYLRKLSSARRRIKSHSHDTRNELFQGLLIDAALLHNRCSLRICFSGDAGKIDTTTETAFHQIFYSKTCFAHKIISLQFRFTFFFYFYEPIFSKDA